jgi:uncharacterized protein involved in exopolysaccharide biosynthesis
MLQKLAYADQLPPDAADSALSPSYLLDVVKRRVFFFIVPFLLVAVVGAVVVWSLPAVYFAEGKILVESQQIPSELVRPTVTALAQERIQTIEQRIMTRDKLLGIATKYQLYSGRQRAFTGTEMLDFMRERTQIRPLDIKLPARGSTRQVIAFTVGFEHETPQAAQRVANELVTMILEEDVRTRTAFATETTRFLEREVKRLEAELNGVEVQIADLKRKQIRAPDEGAERQLMTLRSELLQKSASYSESHPDMKAIKQKLAALEKLVAPVAENGIGLEALQRTQEAIQKELQSNSQRLSAARLGESLERGQQSEKLEVIEQPTLPQKPIRPKREKLLAMVLAFAAMSGAGLVFLLEMLDSTLHRAADIHRVVDANLVVALPYIWTKAEMAARTRRMRGLAALLVFVLVALAGAGFYFQDELAPMVEQALAKVRR